MPVPTSAAALIVLVVVFVLLLGSVIRSFGS
jgi:hypothetical protein